MPFFLRDLHRRRRLRHRHQQHPRRHSLLIVLSFLWFWNSKYNTNTQKEPEKHYINRQRGQRVLTEKPLYQKLAATAAAAVTTATTATATTIAYIESYKGRENSLRLQVPRLVLACCLIFFSFVFSGRGECRMSICNFSSSSQLHLFLLISLVLWIFMCSFIQHTTPHRGDLYKTRQPLFL